MEHKVLHVRLRAPELQSSPIRIWTELTQIRTTREYQAQHLRYQGTRAVDPDPLNPDPDTAFQVNSDPDPGF
jgi:hypothetical protein